MADSRDTAEEKAVQVAREQNAAHYLTEIPSTIEPARRLLETYSGIAPEVVDAHIMKIASLSSRDRAWAIFPYGGIGSFKFLDLNATLQDPTFQNVVRRLKALGCTDTFLDIGCCLGQVVRQLIVEGVPSERLHGTDVQQGFLDLGYDLFRDRDTTKATFVCGDMLRDEDERLEQLMGKVDIIYASAFLHLFEREDQKRAAKRMVGFLKPDSTDAMIFGRNGGPKIPGYEKYVLNEQDFRQMWMEVGENTETSWRIETAVEEDDDSIQVRFAVHRLK